MAVGCEPVGPYEAVPVRQRHVQPAGGGRPANQEKGSASAAYWLPTNGAYRCDYVARQIGVKAKYGLTVTTKEKRAMLSVLRACPAQAVPER